jgi:transketolase
MMNDENLKELRKTILQAAYHAQEGHIPSAYSILDIIWVLYDQVLNTNNHDRFLLSKGQGCLALYAVLVKKGFGSRDDLVNHYCEYESKYGGHPDRNKSKEIEVSTGSLGHGLPIATGIALSNKDSNSRSRVFCLIGDGEANEGSIWEAALLAANHNLNNLICIVDYNHSTDRALNMQSIIDKFKAFGWNTLEINGHNHKEIKKALTSSSTQSPTCIVANTIKGYGCKSIENNPAWHHRSPTQSEYQQFIEEINSI